MALTRADITDPFEPIYTFVDHNGVNTHIASKRLREWCLEQDKLGQLERQLIPIDQELARSFFEKNAVLPQRVQALRQTLPVDMIDWEPIIYCHDGSFGANGGPNVLLVDGHHRYAAAALEGAPFVLGWFLTVQQWEPFQIVGLKDYTEQQLIDQPIISKDHWGGERTIYLRAGTPVEVLERILGIHRGKGENE